MSLSVAIDILIAALISEKATAMVEKYKAKQIDHTQMNLGARDGSFAAQSEIAKESVRGQQIVLDEFEMR